jgi:hypothetical protein
MLRPKKPSQPKHLTTKIDGFQVPKNKNEVFDKQTHQGVNVLNFFSLLQKMRSNKLDWLYLAITFQYSQTFAGNITGACPRRKHLKGPPIRFALALPSNSKTHWKGFPRPNPLAYWASSSAMKEKSFITLTPGCVLAKLY